MSASRARISELEIRTGVVGWSATTTLLIDGVDVLDVQQPVHRSDGSRYPGGAVAFLPANPVGLLPPDSAALLPTTVPRHAMIGICTCGEPGCGSMWLQVRRDGDEVVWEPDPDTPDRTVDTSWRFALRQYLDAIDRGQRSAAEWETPPIRIARELRRQRDSLYGFHLVDSVTGAAMRLLDAVAWPGRDEVLISVASDTGVRELRSKVDDSCSEPEFIQQLHSVDPADYEDTWSATDVERTSDAPAGRASTAPRIVVGSKNFTEHRVLGELYAQALRANGFEVTLRGNLGPSAVLSAALDGGVITMYPEYTGVICSALAKLGERPRTAQDAYEAAKNWQAARGNTMLEPSAFHATGCVVVRRALALERELTAIGDLNRLDSFTCGGPPELATRHAGAEGLRQSYRLDNFTFRPLAFGSQYAALDAGAVDAILGLATDGQLADDSYVVLADPMTIFGFEQVAPVVTNALLRVMPPTFATTLNAITRLLTPEAMITLNRAAQLDGTDPGTVARMFLSRYGFVRTGVTGLSRGAAG